MARTLLANDTIGDVLFVLNDLRKQNIRAAIITAIYMIKRLKWLIVKPMQISKCNDTKRLRNKWVESLGLSNVWLFLTHMWGVSYATLTVAYATIDINGEWESWNRGIWGDYSTKYPWFFPVDLW